MEFCCVYLLRKRKAIRILIKNIRANISDDIFYLHDDFGEKQLSRRKLEEMYINVIIQEGRKLKVPGLPGRKFENRHETYETHLKLPLNTISITRTQDLFNYGSGDQPKKILVVGRPGIGKALLTKKLLYQWTKQQFEFCYDKIVILIRFREFNKAKGKTNLREMLRRHSYGFNISFTNFDYILEYISFMPGKVVLIFDG